jgi:hypothetical protein
MPRLIELLNVKSFRGPITIRVDDVLLLFGSGGQIDNGSSIEFGGPYIPATAVASGEVLTAIGGPGTMLAWARRPGLTVLEIVSGDPWRETEKTILHVNVEE